MHFLCIIMNSETIVIWGDSALQTAYLSSLLGGYHEFEVIAVFDQVKKAVEKARDCKPSIGIVQVEQPGFSCFELTRQWINVCPDMRVLWFSSLHDEEHLLGALRAGAKGYVLSDQAPHFILEAIYALAGGGSPISPAITGHLIRYILEMDGSAEYNLTDRERSILKNLVDGIPIKLIAPLVFLSEDGVKKNLHNIYAKLKVNNGKEAVAKAIREHIV